MKPAGLVFVIMYIGKRGQKRDQDQRQREALHDEIAQLVARVARTGIVHVGPRADRRMKRLLERALARNHG